MSVGGFSALDGIEKFSITSCPVGALVTGARVGEIFEFVGPVEDLLSGGLHPTSNKVITNSSDFFKYVRSATVSPKGYLKHHIMRLSARTS